MRCVSVGCVIYMADGWRRMGEDVQTGARAWHASAEARGEEGKMIN